MSQPVELRTQRLVWRCCGFLAGGRPRRQRAASPYVLLMWLLPLAAAVIIWLTLSSSSAVVGLLVILAVVAVAFYVAIAGSLWWATGAGAPVLVVEHGVIHGRLRSVRRGEPLDADDPSWWDLRIAASELGGVRLARRDRPLRQQLLALDLPAEIARQLRSSPDLGNVPARLTRRVGTPAAWPAPAMLPVGRRRRDVAALVAAIEQARTVEQQR